jgi:hypothetical protein
MYPGWHVGSTQCMFNNFPGATSHTRPQVLDYFQKRLDIRAIEQQFFMANRPLSLSLSLQAVRLEMSL